MKIPVFRELTSLPAPVERRKHVDPSAHHARQARSGSNSHVRHDDPVIMARFGRKVGS